MPKEISFYNRPKKDLETVFFKNAKRCIEKMILRLNKNGLEIVHWEKYGYSVKVSPWSDSMYFEVYEIEDISEPFQSYQVRISNHDSNQLAPNNVIDIRIDRDGNFEFTKQDLESINKEIKVLCSVN